MIGADVSNPVMIGDRDYDINGAAEHGIPTIYVDWGYGHAGESEGSLAVVSKAEELLPLLLPG
jgi:phosphoglycolate phosphatase